MHDQDECVLRREADRSGGALNQATGFLVATDRLGSVRANASGERMSYYPYGEERTSTADGREKFGTYFRDATTQDYADQRYYGVGTGRFFTADPSKASAGPEDPSSWNRYAYVQGDPINYRDTAGMQRQGAGDGNPAPGPDTEGPGEDDNDDDDLVPSVDTTSSKVVLTYKQQLTMFRSISGLRLALGQWSSNAKPCLSDLKAVGLSVDKVQAMAADAGVKFVNALTTPSVLNYMQAYDQRNDTRTDFMISTSAPKTTVWVNMNNFWQTDAAQLAGTIVHEFAHLANPGLSDRDIQNGIGVKVTGQDTNDISLKLATDCFSNIMNFVR